MKKIEMFLYNSAGPLLTEELPRAACRKKTVIEPEDNISVNMYYVGTNVFRIDIKSTDPGDL